MHNLTKKFCISLLTGFLLVNFVGVGIAQEYPAKQITVIQAFKPGGGSDILAQLSQPFLEKILGKGFINQYMPGATGAIAWTKLTKATKPDGYTIAITNTPMLQTNYIINDKITYTIDDLTPIANLVTDPHIIVVGKNSPFKTLQDFIDAAKEKPGTVTVSNAGTGGDDFFAALRFNKLTDTTVQMVPFQGDGPSWQAAFGDKVQVSFNNLGTVYPQIKAGNLRVLAILSAERYELLPDAPTARELGVDLVSGASRGYCAPKNIPAEAKEKLIDAFRQMTADPAFTKACLDRATPVDIKIGDEYAKYLADDEKIFRQIWSEVKN